MPTRRRLQSSTDVKAHFRHIYTAFSRIELRHAKESSVVSMERIASRFALFQKKN